MRTLVITLLTLIAASALPAEASAQPAQFAYIDQQAPYTNPVPPRLTVVAAPRLGYFYRVRVAQAPAPAQLVLGTGTRDVQIDLRILTGNPTWFGYLYLFPDILHVIPPGTGQHEIQFFVPSDPSAAGVKFFQQVIITRPGVSGWTLGRAVRGVTGV